MWETINDVIYYNDSKGTNTDASIKAIEAMSRPTILIAGGYDKKVSFDDWAEALEIRLCSCFTRSKRQNRLRIQLKTRFTNIIFTESLKEAVDECANNAKPRCSIIVTCMCKLGMFDTMNSM